MHAKRSSQKTWTVVMIVCIVVAALCVGALLWMQAQQAKVDKALDNAVSPAPTAAPSAKPSATLTPAPSASAAPEALSIPCPGC